jgi:hypothetical protein
LSRRIDNVIHNALRAAFAKCLNHGRANPARAAGDKRDFATEIERIAHIARE